jgi:hypothetical protein
MDVEFFTIVFLEIIGDHCFAARMVAIITVASFKVIWRTSCTYVSNQDKYSAY